MRFDLLLGLLAVPLVGGVVSTRLWFRYKEQGTIAMRLARSTQTTILPPPDTLLKEYNWTNREATGKFILELPGLNAINKMLIASGLEDKLLFFLASTLVLFLLPLLIAFACGINSFCSSLVGLALASLPLIILKSKAEMRRTRFCEQLPDAIDLMVAVLRSGHSISQAVQAVASEIPAPCGKEYEAILNRMNLGQPLSESLLLSYRLFRSYELDLMRRAVAIQAEVGGSLAELLEKTNLTLRQRLKLSRELKVITAQSRLSAQIVGSLPIVLAIALNAMSPGYLQLLLQDRLGQILLGSTLVLEIIGILLMNRMSTMKI